jgi:uncharacterized damage-inducible protein DinB
MDLDLAIEALAAQELVIAALAADIDPEQARVRPAEGAWSVVEVLAHLLDEEREDFRLRLDLTLHQPETEWPPIDPEGWVTARDYQSRDPLATLAEWRSERQRSLAWLRGLAAPDLTVARRHPAGFELRAGDLLASWVAHDLLHLRQLVELRYALVQRLTQPYDIRYAGDW